MMHRVAGRSPKVSMARLAVAALGLGLCAAAGLAPVPAAASGPTIEDLAGTELTVTLGRERVRWGDEVEVAVKARNSTGLSLVGGLYVSFDEDVLVLDVQGGTLLRSGAKAYHLKQAGSAPIRHPMVEVWDRDWKPGTERTVTITLLPIGRGERVRILARTTFIAPGRPPRMLISPGRTESRSLDQTEFPTASTYLWVSRETSLRRSIRRIERRIQTIDEAQQRRFAEALGLALEDPKSFTGFTGLSDPSLKQTSQSLLSLAPAMADLLKRDPLEALANLRCLMTSLRCVRALAYFRVPAALWADLSSEEEARLEAKRRIEQEKGGHGLIALLEAEDLPYFRDKASGAIVVEVNRTPVKVGPTGPVVGPLLERIVEILGPAADTVHAAANGSSFKRLRDELAGGRPGGGRPKP